MLKTLLTLWLVAFVSGDIHGEYLLKKWAYKKAIEACIGQENVENFMIKKRQAIAKCSQQEAPELALPIFQKPYRAVGAMVESALGRPTSYSGSDRLREGEESYWLDNAMRKYFLRRVLKRLERLDLEDDDDDDDFGNERRDDDDDREESDLFRIFRSRGRPKHGLGRIFRNRFARDTEAVEEAEEIDEISDLGEKLTAKLESEKRKVEQLIGNYTCVLRECDIIDEDNQINESGVVRVFEKEMSIEDAWLRSRLVSSARKCIEYAQSLPEAFLVEVGGGFLDIDIARLYKFKKCMKLLKLRTCRNYDIKQKLEKYFGPLEVMVKQTGLKEENLLPFVMNMLHSDPAVMDRAQKLF